MKLRFLLYNLKFHGFLMTFHNLHVEGKTNISDNLEWLAQGPRKYATKHEGYQINGCRFHIKSSKNIRAT